MSPDLEGDISATGEDLRLSDVQKRWLRNCESVTNPGFVVSWEPDLRRCPKSQITPEAWVCVEWWRSWKDFGSLPYPGGMMSQPAFVFEAIRVCENSVEEVRREKAEKDMKETKKVVR